MRAFWKDTRSFLPPPQRGARPGPDRPRAAGARPGAPPGALQPEPRYRPSGGTAAPPRAEPAAGPRSSGWPSCGPRSLLPALAFFIPLRTCGFFSPPKLNPIPRAEAHPFLFGVPVCIGKCGGKSDGTEIARKAVDGARQPLLPPRWSRGRQGVREDAWLRSVHPQGPPRDPGFSVLSLVFQTCPP